jgi:hypothetical protein
MKRQVLKPLHDVFNDGFLQYGYRTINRDSKGKRIGESFNPSGKLAFQLMDAREEDYEMAGAKNASLDVKVKTPFPPDFRRIKKTNLKCVIDSKEYDVIKVDWDRSKRYLFFYLQEVGELNE